MPQFHGNIRVVFFEFPPYVMKYVGRDGEIRLHGLIAGLFTNLTASLNLSYTALPTEDGEFGMPLPGDRFNGAFLMLQENKSDLGIGPFVSEEAPFKYFTVMPALHFTRVAILSGMETAFVTEVANFMMTLDIYVWALLCVCPLILAIMMNTRDSFRAKIDNRKKPAFSSYLFKLLECLLQESCDLPHRDFFHRLLFAPWILGAFIVMQTFAGLLKANTAVQSPTKRIDSLEDLMGSEGLHIYYPRNMIIDTILHSIPGERGKRFNEVLDRRGRGVFPHELREEPARLETVRGRAVLVVDEASLRGSVGRWCTTTPEFYYFAGEHISFLHGTWYTRKDLNPLWIEAIKMRILWANAMGVEYIRRHLLFSGHTGCVTTNTRQRVDKAEAMSMEDVVGVFATLLIPLAVSTPVIFFEIFVHRFDSRSGDRRRLRLEGIAHWPHA